MTVLETYRHYLIIKEGDSVGIFDPAIQMIVEFFRTVKEAEEEINAIEEDL